MTQGPFLLCLCQRGAFTGFQTIFFSSAHLCRSGKPSVTARTMNGASRHQRRANREECRTCFPNKFESADTAHFFDVGLPGFTLPVWFISFFSAFFLSRISLRIFINMPLPPFTSIFAPFSWYASGWSFSFWAQR